MSAVVEWTLDRPPNLDKDFPDDRANGERDVWYERRRRPEDKTLPVVDLLASEEVQKQQRHETIAEYSLQCMHPAAPMFWKRRERGLVALMGVPYL